MQGPCLAPATMLDWNNIVNKFKFQLCNCNHFQTNSLCKYITSSYASCYGLHSTTTILQQEWIWLKITHEDWNAIKLRNQIKPNQTKLKAWIFHHLHHHVVLVARISLTLSRQFSLSFIASGRSSGQYSVSSHSCWMYFVLVILLVHGHVWGSIRVYH